MATRTTETAVREIISTSLSSPQVNAFILDASVWIDEEVATYVPVPSATRLEIIERYLACALIRLRDLGLKDASVENVTETYQVDPELTDYLTRAASFDPTGQVRANFLAPKPVALPQPIIIPAVFRIGDGFDPEHDD